MTGGLDADDNLVGLHYPHLRPVDPGLAAPPKPAERHGSGHLPGRQPRPAEAAFGYTVPNLLVDHAMRNPHIPPGFWRGVNINQNAVYMECFMDELAEAAGQDPLEFRRKLMGNSPSMLAVLKAVAEKAGCGKPAPQGIYHGIAQVMGYGSYVAGVAEVSVTDGDKIKVIASSPPPIPATSSIRRRSSGRSRARSSMACRRCSTARSPSRTAPSSRPTSTATTSMRIDEMPKVEIVLVPTGGFWGGVGEPTIGVAAPAVLNAYFAATGKRIRSVPLRDQNITFA